MTAQSAIARPLMALAIALAPASRTDWSQAMQREFEALDGAPGSLSWAAGCLAAALGWRLKAEMPFGLGFIVVVLSGSWIFCPMIFELMYPVFEPHWMVPVSNALLALKAFSCFLLAAAWPRRAAFAGLIVPLVWQDGTMPDFFLTFLKPAFSNPWARLSNQPDTLTVVYAFQFLFDEMWPCLLAAALGWSLARIWRTPRISTVCS